MVTTLESLSLAEDVVLVTGAAKRLGAATARLLHAHGASIAVHYHRSAAPG